MGRKGCVMSITEILASAQYLVDGKGNKKAVQVDLSVWEEIVATLTDLDDEAQWEESFANSQDVLEMLADEAASLFDSH